MKKIVAISPKIQTIAQTSIEGKTSDPLEVRSTNNFNLSTNYLGLVFLSICVFLFLSFLLFKRKSQEVRVSIFVSLFLGLLLAVYTSIQISTQALIGDRQKKQDSERETKKIANQNITPKESDRKNNKTRKTQENQSKEEIQQQPKTNSKKTTKTTSEETKNKTNENIKPKSRINSQKTSVDQKQDTPVKQNHDTSLSQSENQNLKQSTKQKESKIVSSDPNDREKTIGGNNVSVNLRENHRRNNSTASVQRSQNQTFSATVQTSLFRPILKLGNYGDDVNLLQTILKELGYYTETIDGDYGRSTEIAVQNFQQDNNLLPDGIIGFSTCNILKAKSKKTEIDCQ